MKKSVFFLLMTLILGLSFSAVEAQTKQRIVLTKARGEAGAAVTGQAKGTISGDAYRDYTFRIPKGRGVDIGLNSKTEDAPLTFDLIAPNGKVLQKNIGDYLDELKTPGTYTIRVYMLKDDADIKRPLKASYTVTVFMYI